MSFTHGINNQSKRNDFQVHIIPQKRRSSFGSSLKMLAWNLTVGGTRALKRAMDIFGSLALLAILFLPMLVICILIKLDSEGPIIYQSKRIGQFGRPFNFLKFRSMYINVREIEAKMEKERKEKEAEAVKNGQTIENQALSDANKPKGDDPRITRIGRFIRKTSIDELPQLVNVLLGDMSLVGPRPPIPSEVATYTLEQRKRLNITPGITCTWQVSGRSDIPFEDQVKLDIAYIQSQSFWKDCMILLKTIPAVFTGKGAY